MQIAVTVTGLGVELRISDQAGHRLPIIQLTVGGADELAQKLEEVVAQQRLPRSQALPIESD